MIHLLLSALWNSAFGQFGLAGMVLVGAVAVFLWVPLPGARHVAVAVASVCIIFLFLAPKLYIEGIRHEKAKWDAAEASVAQRGADARAAAEREVARQTAEAGESNAGRSLVRRILHPRGLRRDAVDPRDRDNP